MSKVWVQIVLYNSLQSHGAEALKRTVEAILQQDGFKVGSNLHLTVLDNASFDGGADFLSREFGELCEIKRLSTNLGFAAGQNVGAADFLASDYDFFLILNPDIRLENNALQQLVLTFKDDNFKQVGLVCPKLYRADSALEPLMPLQLDAAGMVLTKALRHLDRNSERGQVEKVFGGSGACLLVKRECVEDLLLSTPTEDEVLNDFYPSWKSCTVLRAPFFDEAFFAYREDADLAWRANLLGWTCLYQPKACGYHRRVVVPEKRSILPPELNRFSVRNRFLLQINNYAWQQSPLALIYGVLFRNLLVVLAVLIKERTSLSAFKDLWRLKKRALARRRILLAKQKKRGIVFKF